MKRIMLAILLLCSCSIKEDRSGCPSYIRLSLSRTSLSAAKGLPVKVLVWGTAGADTVLLDSSVPEVWRQVGRGLLRIEALLLNGATPGAAWGAQSDSLWASSELFRIETESCEKSVTLHKRWATISFVFDGGIEQQGRRFVLCGQMAGSRFAGAPGAGDFRCILDVERQEASVRVPPLLEGRSLLLLCQDRNSGRHIWNLDLSRDLADAGYDWNAADLADIEVHIKTVPLQAGIEIVGWGDGGVIESDGL